MRKHKVDGWNNFCRVFELPERFPSDFCFGGGIPVNFQMVDWFNPVPELGNPAVSKEEWIEKVGDIEIKKIDVDKLEESLLPFIQKKMYIKPNRKYLIIYNFGASTIFSGGDHHEEEKT